MTLLLLTLGGCLVPWDGDGDGHPWTADCDDRDPAVGADRTWYKDADGDGLGDPDNTARQCAAPEGFLAVTGDCDDTDPLVPDPYGVDADGDGRVSATCAGGDDCDDTDTNTYPGAIELCDDKQNDCAADWTADEGIVTWFEGLETGEEGQPCTVETELTGGGAVECTTRECPYAVPGMPEGLCCVCELGPALAEATDAVWQARLGETRTGFAPDALLSVCSGDWPLSLDLQQSSGQPQRVTVAGRAAVSEGDCEAGATEGLSVLRGTAERPVIAAEGNGGLELTLTGLVVTSGAACVSSAAACDEAPVQGRGGVVVHLLNSATLEGVCIRENANVADASLNYGGGLSLKHVEQVNLYSVWITKNCSAAGGGLFAHRANVEEMINVRLTYNTAWCLGGGLALLGGAPGGEAGDSSLRADSLVLQCNMASSGIGGGMLVWGIPEGAARVDLSGSFVIGETDSVPDCPGGDTGSGVALVEAVNQNGARIPVCSALEVFATYFGGHTGEVDIEHVDLYSTWLRETVGQGLGDQHSGDYQTEACP